MNDEDNFDICGNRLQVIKAAPLKRVMKSSRASSEIHLLCAMDQSHVMLLIRALTS